MNYNQIITEGIIKVPPSLFDAYAKYVGAVVATIANTAISSLRYSDEPNDIADCKELKAFISQIQSRYSAKLVNPYDLDQLIDTAISIKFEPQEVFAELPKNLQQEKVLQALSTVKLQLVIADHTSRPGYKGSFDSESTDNVYSIELKLKMHESRPQFIAKGGIEMFNTLYHELQHLIQRIAIGNIQANTPQLKRNDGYYTDTDAYYSSPVEFSTQVGDLAHEAMDNLRAMNSTGDLTDFKVDNIKKAVKMANDDSPLFLQALKNRGMEKEFKRALRDIYSTVLKNYDEVVSGGTSDEYDSTEHDVNAEIDFLATSSRRMRKRGFVMKSGKDWITAEKDQFTMFIQAVSTGFLVKCNYQGSEIQSLVGQDVIDRVLKTIEPGSTEIPGLMQYLKSSDISS